MVRRMLAPAIKSVGLTKADIADAERLQIATRCVDQRLEAIDRPDLACEFRHERGSVAAPGTDQQVVFLAARRHLQRCEKLRHSQRLGQYLTARQWQDGILGRKLVYRLVDEIPPVDGLHCRQDGVVPYALLAKLQDEACGAERVSAHCFHSALRVSR